MAINTVCTGSIAFNTGVGTSATVPMTTIAPAGSILIACVTATGGSARTFTPPDNDWILILRQDNGTNPANATYYKIASVGEPSSYIFTIDNAVSTAVTIVGFTGVNTNNPLAGTGFANGVTSSTITYGAVTSSTSNGRLMKTVAARNTSAQPTVINGGANTNLLIQSSNTASTYMLSSIMQDVATGVGSITPEDSLLDVSCQKATITFVLNEAVSAPAPWMSN